MNIHNIANINSIIIKSYKLYTYLSKPGSYKSTDKSFEVLPKHSGYVFVLEYFSLN